MSSRYLPPFVPLAGCAPRTPGWAPPAHFSLPFPALRLSAGSRRLVLTHPSRFGTRRTSVLRSPLATPQPFSSRAKEQYDEGMAKRSAGILLFRKRDGELQVFLVHPGGPFWRNKDAGAWSIPKGEYSESEDPLDAAKREFQEETGISVHGELISLDSIRQSSAKVVTAWALEGDCSAASIRSNTFSMEWPPRSGRTQEFPEIDRAEWFSIDEARKRVVKGQAGFLDRLIAALND
jgi:predicted NUDIX family NTP pyrophosphohydrolase